MQKRKYDVDRRDIQRDAACAAVGQRNRGIASFFWSSIDFLALSAALTGQRRACRSD
jgi:hypothetical protein